MEQLTFQVREFTGPLDLLLSLITTHKMDIYDIPIAEILDQYLEQIARMQSANMTLASEFLTMAARLIYIKTAQLLPKNETAEEMKRQITGELIEYQAVQETAGLLRRMWRGGQVFVRAPSEAPGLPYDRRHELHELTSAYRAVEGRVRQKSEGRETMTRFSEELTQKPVSVASRITVLLRRLTEGAPERAYSELFDPEDSPSGRVATFLALLELMKARRLLLREENGRQYLRLAGPEESGDLPREEYIMYE